MPETKNKRRLTFVKLGGSLITDKGGDESVRTEVLERLGHELAGVSRELPGVLVIGHGSGSFGHAAAADSGFDRTIPLASQREAVSRIQDSAARLHRHVIAALRAAGACPYSIVPGSAFGAVDGNPALLASDLPERILEAGLLPVLYGDIVVDRRENATILSTESLFLELARALRSRAWSVERVLWLGETDGVLDSAGRRIPELTAEEASALAGSVEGAAGTDVTGGMRLRLESVARLARLGVPSLIADGRVSGLIERALNGEGDLGTAVLACS